MRFLPAQLALNPLLMPVETLTGDRQYYRLFYLERLAQPRGKWVLPPPVSDLAMVFIVLKTICAPRELINGREVFLWRSESQHWPGSCCNNWRNKVNADGFWGELTL